MKAVLMSIRPQHLVNILNGDKTIEIRKRFPKDFRGWVYMYATKARPRLYRLPTDNKKEWYSEDNLPNGWVVYGGEFNSKVVARFWVDKVEEVFVDGDNAGHYIYHTSLILLATHLFAIHISKLEIFDKPKELGEFYKNLRYSNGQIITPDILPADDEEALGAMEAFRVVKAPQSWQYIYIKEDK